MKVCVVCGYSGDHDSPLMGIIVDLSLMETGASKPSEVKTAYSIFLL